MIIEGIVTSRDSGGLLNIAPMGPIVDGDFDRLILRPFQTSTTFQNLAVNRCGVFHVVDSVEVIALSAIGQLETLPETFPAREVAGEILKDCCRWFEFRVEHIDDSDQRSVMNAIVVSRGNQRPFRGFNRARHAILEVTIAATRIHVLPREEILRTFDFFRSAVEKTGDPSDILLFKKLDQFVRRSGPEAS